MQITLKLKQNLFDAFDISVLNNGYIEIKEVKEDKPYDFLITVEYTKPEDLFNIGLATVLQNGKRRPIIINSNSSKRYEKYIINN